MHPAPRIGRPWPEETVLPASSRRKGGPLTIHETDRIGSTPSDETDIPPCTTARFSRGAGHRPCACSPGLWPGPCTGGFDLEPTQVPKTIADHAASFPPS